DALVTKQANDEALAKIIKGEDKRILLVIGRKYHEIGIIRLERQAGQFISVYDMERTLVECLRTAYHVDIQVIAPAFQAYFKKGAVDYAKLYHYAQLFKVTEKLQSYVEVLS
ncbi:hypothetical protein QM350_08860, partial [Streptococcus infantis]